jgi:phosphoglycerate-specific signal transduction histidine kinase
MNAQRREWVTTLQVLVLGAWILLLTPPALADPLLRPDHGHDAEIMQAVHKAQHEVDRAWEVFHKAALGGTLASPAVQADVEQALHESRGLLVKAREAADRGDRATLQPLLDRIDALTKRAIAESQEHKR